MTDDMRTRRQYLNTTAVGFAGIVLAGCLAPTARQPQSQPGPGPQQSSRGVQGPRGSQQPPMGPHGPVGPQGTGRGWRHSPMGPYGPVAPQDTTGTLEQWFLNVENYTGVIDLTGQSMVTVQVGAPGNGGDFAFEPPAIRISRGTTVRWMWTGRGGTHDVAFVDDVASSLVANTGVNFERTFSQLGTYLYYCTPHRAIGMKGVVIVM